MSEPNRIFNLHRFFGNAPFQFKTDSSGIQRLSDDDRNLLIDVHGNAMMSNTPAAKAAYGVYFGDGSRHNECGLVPAGVHLGNQVSPEQFSIPRIIWDTEEPSISEFVILLFQCSKDDGTLRLTLDRLPNSTLFS